MKEVCTELNMTYETIRFYCDEGLVPNVKRDKNNWRIFDDRNLNWLKSLRCLKRCGMSIKDMKEYMGLCLQGISSVPERKAILADHRRLLLEQLSEIQENIAFIDSKQEYFDDILSGKTQYSSNLIDVECDLRWDI